MDALRWLACLLAYSPDPLLATESFSLPHLTASVTVLLVVAARRVVMDTIFHPDDPIPGSIKIKAPAPKLIFVDELKHFKMAANSTYTGDALLRYLSLIASV